jgi:hypothetical protein
MMKRKEILLLLIILTITICCKGQHNETKNVNQPISFNEENWSIQDKEGIEQQMNIVEYVKRKSLHLPVGYSAFLKDLKPKNFVINFDFNGIVAPGFGFRGQSRNNNKILAQLDSLNLAKTDWKLIKSDDDGLVNISPFYDESSGSVSLSCTIISESKKSVKMNFDYTNQLTMVFNSEIIFNKGLNSENEGRVFVNDTEIELSLAKGKNELIFVVTADDSKNIRNELITNEITKS